MINLIALCFVFSNFTLKWYIPVGSASGAGGKILVSDTDRDGHYELYISDFHYPIYIHICELHLPNTWQIDSFTNVYNQVAWDIGDFDCDGLYDLLQFGHVEQPDPATIIFVTESADSFSYPTNEVWRDTTGPQALDVGDEVFDIDQDGYPELVKNGTDYSIPYGNISIYEFSSDNQYELIFIDTSYYYSPLGTHAFGDFDQDGHNEVVFAGSNNTYWIYESPSNNTYERLRFDLLPTANIRDCIDVADADGDGKWEFVLKGSWAFGDIEAFIFESIGNNSYDTIQVMRFPGGMYYGGHSDAGDVDGDSIPEIVLEGRQTVHIIKASGNDSFYVWQTLPGNVNGMNIKIFDLDNNGYAEIIMSSEWQTWIYEWQPQPVYESSKTTISRPTLSCHPNFTSGSTLAKFSLVKNDYIVLNLYDNCGRQVKNISAGIKPAGMYIERIDLYNLPDGVYYIILRTSDQILINKILKIQ